MGKAVCMALLCGFWVALILVSPLFLGAKVGYFMGLLGPLSLCAPAYGLFMMLGGHRE